MVKEVARAFYSMVRFLVSALNEAEALEELHAEEGQALSYLEQNPSGCHGNRLPRQSRDTQEETVQARGDGDLDQGGGSRCGEK